MLDTIHHSVSECEGLCIGCTGTGKHPHAGQPPRRMGNNSDYVSLGTPCSWCGGDGKCYDEMHAPEEELCEVCGSTEFTKGCPACDPASDHDEDQRSSDGR